MRNSRLWGGGEPGGDFDIVDSRKEVIVDDEHLTQTLLVILVWALMSRGFLFFGFDV